MTRVRSIIAVMLTAVAGLTAVLVLALPAGAGAWTTAREVNPQGVNLDPNDSITLSGITSSNGVYAGYPFSLTGTYDDAGMDATGGGAVIFVPKASAPSTTSCPADYTQTVQQIEQDNGLGQNNTYLFTTQAKPANPLAVSGDYTAPLNTPDDPDSAEGTTVINISKPGVYIACAYLLDQNNNTLAYTDAPYTFTVRDPTVTTTAAEAFGGPVGGPNHKRPTNLTLTVKPEHTPLREPGDNLIEISGAVPSNSGQVLLTVTLKNTHAFNGCEGTDQEDLQIARASGGGPIAQNERINQNGSGRINAVIDLHLKKRGSGTGILCAYVVNGTQSSDLAVGYDRFTLPKVRK